jgi:hypothetical protein
VRGMREPGCDDDLDNAATVVRGLRLLDAAADYCARGEAVFLLHGKLPLIPEKDDGKGFHDATTDFNTLLSVYGRYRGATGLGMAIRPGAFVVDVDPRKGGEQSLRALEDEHGALSETEEQATGSDGRHLIFTAPGAVRQLVCFHPGLDTRVAGKGYIVVEPSIHPETQRPYRWVRRMAPVPAPRWLLDLVAEKPAVARPEYVPAVNVSSAHLTRRRRYATAALAGLAADVAKAADGCRNDTLNHAWWRILTFRDVVPESEARAELARAAASAGLDEREIAKVLR